MRTVIAIAVIVVAALAATGCDRSCYSIVTNEQGWPVVRNTCR